MSRARAAVWNLTAAGIGRRQAVTWRRAWAMRERRFDALLMALGTTMGLSLYFWLLPGVDLALAEAFHSPDTGFALSQSPVLRALRKSSTLALVAVLLTAVILLVRAGLREGWRGLMAARRSWCVLAGLVLGPVLLVNGLLKGQWGRPRPVHLEAFGGDAPYVEVWRISDWCTSNCSFVSGESASAAWVVAAVILLPQPWRGRLLLPVLTYAAALSVNRIAFGGHFLSDTVLSWALVASVMALLCALMLPRVAEARVRRRGRRATGAPALS